MIGSKLFLYPLGRVLVFQNRNQKLKNLNLIVPSRPRNQDDIFQEKAQKAELERLERHRAAIEEEERLKERRDQEFRLVQEVGNLLK